MQAASRLNSLPFTPQLHRIDHHPVFRARLRDHVVSVRNFPIATDQCFHGVCFNSKTRLVCILQFPSFEEEVWIPDLREQEQHQDILFLSIIKSFLRTVPWTRPSGSSLLKPCQVTSEDSEIASSGESVLRNEQTLERELQIAVKEENYAKAAKIRDSLRFLQEDSKSSVLAANARFYNAFKNGNLGAMQSLWSKNDHVCVVHPGVSGISGYDLVMGSWEFVWAEYEFPLAIEIKDVQAHVKGDIGYVTCIEMVKTKGSSWGRQFATNVFERIDGQWRICVHHASYVDL